MEASVNYCCCKSSCSTKRKENSSRGCPCKGKNLQCSVDCKCGTRNKPCKNKGDTEENRVRERSAIRSRDGFRGLSQSNVNETEDQQREKEHNDVKTLIYSLDDTTVRKLAIRSLRRGIGSMDYIDTLLIAEDDLDTNDNTEEVLDDFSDETEGTSGTSHQNSTGNLEAAPSWCVCSNCSPMPQEIENKCCKLKSV
ncbi:Hypothetical predicted protein [Paramuricea clavata]|uniref:Uncharacterized protein n=1 Tax=Paramuricea clavata TaxID=317549 RepID=A0A7D9E6N2_PARCT|nr:Hypothetical predicted protein [Paramuricea clavata]